MVNKLDKFLNHYAPAARVVCGSAFIAITTAIASGDSTNAHLAMIWSSIILIYIEHCAE